MLLDEMSKSMAQWQGLYKVTQKIGLVCYEEWQPGRRKTCQMYHILKKWREREFLFMVPYPDQQKLEPQVRESECSRPVAHVEDLYAAQQAKLEQVVQEFPKGFTEEPGFTQMIKHRVETSTNKVL